jgi:hypothetical protein
VIVYCLHLQEINKNKRNILLKNVDNLPRYTVSEKIAPKSVAILLAWEIGEGA